MWGLAPWGAGWLRVTEGYGDFWTEFSSGRCSESRIKKVIVNVEIYIKNHLIHLLPASLSMSENPSPPYPFFLFWILSKFRKPVFRDSLS